MGEIILSIYAGGCLVAAGIFLRVYLGSEAKREIKKDIDK